MSRAQKTGVVIGGAWLGLRGWAALRPSAFPCFARAIIEVPRPVITRRRLLEILAPEAGERMLEFGPGTGYYTLDVAARLVPAGTLDILDIRRPFLDHTMNRARRRGLANVVPRLGDGGSLSDRDGRFDAAFLVSVLGEVSDPCAALRELRRVLKPGGRLVVGEIVYDPDFPRFAWLMRQTAAAGLGLERRVGTALGYFARFRPDVAGR